MFKKQHPKTNPGLVAANPCPSSEGPQVTAKCEKENVRLTVVRHNGKCFRNRVSFGVLIFEPFVVLTAMHNDQQHIVPAVHDEFST